MKIDISFEMIDNIIHTEMFYQYNNLKEEIKEQKIIKNPLDYQKEDLIYNENLLGAVKTMLKHYTAHPEWPEELKDEGW